MQYDVSIIVACYNEEPHLVKSVAEVEKVMKQTKYSYEMIFVDDCSRDNTRRVIQELAQGRDNVQVLLHEENIGRGGTVCDGVRLARGTYSGFLDIDLEVHARYIPSMIQALEEGADVATAFRVYKVYVTPSYILRHILSVGYRRFSMWLLDLPFRDTETGYKFFRRDKILPVIEETQNKKWFWDTEFMALAHRRQLKVVEIPALFIRRVDKGSTVRVFHDSVEYLMELFRFKRRHQNRR